MVLRDHAYEVTEGLLITVLGTSGMLSPLEPGADAPQPPESMVHRWLPAMVPPGLPCRIPGGTHAPAPKGSVPPPPPPGWCAATMPRGPTPPQSHPGKFGGLPVPGQAKGLRCILRVDHVLELKEAHNNHCAMCSTELLWSFHPKDTQQWSVDCLRPSEGHAPSNVQLCCLKCSRHSRTTTSSVPLAWPTAWRGCRWGDLSDGSSWAAVGRRLAMRTGSSRHILMSLVDSISKRFFCFGRRQLAPDFLNLLQGQVSWGRHGRSHLSWWGDCQADTMTKLLPRAARGWLSSWRQYVLQDNPVAMQSHKCIFFGARQGRPLGAAWRIQGHGYGITGGQQIGEVSGGTDWWTDYLSTLVIFFLSGSNGCRFGLRYLVHSLARSVSCGPGRHRAVPLRYVGQPDFDWSVCSAATSIAWASEAMGHPWGSLRSPKVIRRWVYPNWTENWCTRPPAMPLARADRYWAVPGALYVVPWCADVRYIQPGQKIGACPACYSCVATMGWGPAGGWGGPSLQLQLQVARCGCRWRATPKIATIWPTKKLCSCQPFGHINNRPGALCACAMACHIKVVQNPIMYTTYASGEIVLLILNINDISQCCEISMQSRTRPVIFIHLTS